MNKIFNIFIQRITLKMAIIFTLLFITFFYVINFSDLGVSGLLKITDGANILDFEFGYSKDEAYQILTALGIEGRTFYLKRILPIDFLFPLSYMFIYAGWIAFLIKYIYGIRLEDKTITYNKLLNNLLYLPIFAALFDFIENVGIIFLLINYPSLPSWSTYIASYAGILKTVFTIGSMAITVVFIFIFIIVIFKKMLIKKRNN